MSPTTHLSLSFAKNSSAIHKGAKHLQALYPDHTPTQQPIRAKSIPRHGAVNHSLPTFHFFFSFLHFLSMILSRRFDELSEAINQQRGFEMNEMFELELDGA